jgi:hypothetical protein
MYLMILPKEVDKENDRNADCGTVYRQILINAKLKTGTLS